jgi:hypothetical protein
MKYLLSALFIIVSTSSYAGKFEDMCVKIGYKADTEAFSKCVQKLQARKKPLNDISDSQLAKKSSINTGAVVGEVILQVGVNAVASGLATGKVQNPLSGASASSSSSTVKYKKGFPGVPDALGGNVNSQAMEILNMQKLGIIK